ncbi:histidine decarboxylase [Fastidiosibacter lacustris]|uniref:histidine decarboxylase n=1 Tax=Fastidiosibacter lacustris TaxID=2056695 RepID=UPI000E343467|nr:histidine decarboxylase [Fastidiosibacter lacustris]
MNRDFIERLSHNSKLYIGYPPATDFKYDYLSDVLNYSINNLGNPENLSNAFSSHEYEKEVIHFFLKLYKSSYHESWGYISHCGTEAALNGCWLGRNYLSDSNRSNCIILASEYAHYCIDKIANILNLPLIRIKTDEKGNIIEDALSTTLNLNKGKSVIFFATLGSTITSSIDHIDLFKKHADAFNIKYYIHADAAFDGSFLPFTKYQLKLGYDFDSINISGHKFIGSPIPSGIFLVNKKYLKNREIEYVKNNDLTIAGSRNGISPILLYEGIRNIGGYNGLKERYIKCLNNANEILQYAIENNINAWKNDHAITVVFDRVDDEIMKKWHAPSYKRYTTITVLPKTNFNMIKEFINDITFYKNYKKTRDNTITYYPSKVSSLL